MSLTQSFRALFPFIAPRRDRGPAQEGAEVGDRAERAFLARSKSERRNEAKAAQYLNTNMNLVGYARKARGGK